jgi:hypothetical protein
MRWATAAKYEKNKFVLYLIGNWGSSVSIVSDYRLDDRDLIPSTGKDISCILCVQLWGPPSLLSEGYQG